MLEHKHFRLWKEAKNLYINTVNSRDHQIAILVYTKKILCVAQEIISEQIINLSFVLLIAQKKQLISLFVPLCYIMSKHDRKKYILALKIEQLFVKMIQSAGCSGRRSLDSIFAERSGRLEKDTLNVEYVKPLLLHIFAWINLLNGHNLCPER